MRHLTLSLLFACALLTGCQGQNGGAMLPDACYQPPESGMCKAAFTRYYYDADSNSCQRFIWGGCKGSVPFDTLEACVSSCNADTPDTTPPSSGKGAPR